MKESKQDKEVFLSLESIWEMDCVCWMHSVVQLTRYPPFPFLSYSNGDLSAYGSRCQAHQFESRTATLLGFSRSTVYRGYQGWVVDQRTSSQLDTTVGSIAVNIGQRPCWCFWHLVCSPLTNWGCSEGKGGVTTQFLEGIFNVLYTQCIYTLQPIIVM